MVCGLRDGKLADLAPSPLCWIYWIWIKSLMKWTKSSLLVDPQAAHRGHLVMNNRKKRERERERDSLSLSHLIRLIFFVVNDSYSRRSVIIRSFLLKKTVKMISRGVEFFFKMMCVFSHYSYTYSISKQTTLSRRTSTTHVEFSSTTRFKFSGDHFFFKQSFEIVGSFGCE